jgi:hypothetical protein
MNDKAGRYPNVKTRGAFPAKQTAISAAMSISAFVARH